VKILKKAGCFLKYQIWNFTNLLDMQQLGQTRSAALRVAQISQG